ncbi:MAG: integrase [Isosphaera sp.]|nr:integrase [Isosphaera sp.]
MRKSLPVPVPPPADCPPAVAAAGAPAVVAWEEFFDAQIRNPHTRALYRRAVVRFLRWLGDRPEPVPLPAITPGMVGRYFDAHPGGVPTRKAELAALRRFFDVLVTRHVVVLNPAASVRGERYRAVEGLTPEITPDQVRRLFASLDGDDLAGLRDRALVAVLVYTAARAGAVAALRRKHLAHDGTQYTLRFAEKGGKAREIPVRHDLEQLLLGYLDRAGLAAAGGDAPFFQTLARRRAGPSAAAGWVSTGRAMTGVDVCRMVKRRMAAAGLPARLSPHSFRVATITDLLAQNVSLEDVQHLAGHADPRTTRLYDRRPRRVTRNVVERITL